MLRTEILSTCQYVCMATSVKLNCIAQPHQKHLRHVRPAAKGYFGPNHSSTLDRNVFIAVGQAFYQSGGSEEEMIGKI